jgi:hypothetical protein
MAERVSPKRGVRTKILQERKKLTTYVDADHFVSLKEVSEATQIPMGRLLDQALNEYMASLGVQAEPAAIPIDKEIMKTKIKDAKEQPRATEE